MIRYFPDLIQGSDEWLQARCGLLTASEMKLILTPTLKVASNDKERAHLYELLAQRITKYVEPSYIGDDMLRGMQDELDARALYDKHYAPVTETGFVTNDKWGFTIGYSPDGLIGNDGLIECKSRRQGLQMKTIVELEIPPEHFLQPHTGILVTERQWCDYISYTGGLHMLTLKVWPDDKVQQAIIEASAAFEAKLAEKMARYMDILTTPAMRILPTERRVEQEMYV